MCDKKKTASVCRKDAAMVTHDALTVETTKTDSPQLVVYRASAGSGKTFTLAVEYIKLLVQNPLAYRNILAVTFTNKATAEMKERILSQLYGIGKGLPDSQAYLEEVHKKTGLSEMVIRTNAYEALNHIIHDYSRFYVETIDTFSVSVMRNLAKELGVGTNLNIELNSDEALSDAVDSMIDNLQDGADVLSWLSEYIMDRIYEDKSWRVFDDIKKFGSQIFNETFVEQGTQLRKQLKNPTRIADYKKTLFALRNKLKLSLKQKASDFLCSLADNQIATEDLNGKSKCPALSYFNKLAGDDLESIKWTTKLSDWSQHSELWAQASSPKRILIEELAKEKYTHMLSDAEKERRLLISCRLSLKHINDLRLLARISEELELQNKKKNRFLLSNINELLHKFVKDSDTPFVYEKLGTTISNVMMDEFQDTSRLQWKNFRPLILEGLAQGNDSLIVGDVKQSIYRWRNGDWNILNTELRNNFDRFPIVSKTLATNRRSAPTVIAFNNALFPQVREVLNRKNEAERGIRSTTLEHAYEDVRQESLDSTQRGFVRVSFIPENKKGEPKTYEPTMLKKLVEQVEELTASGIEEKDIAILVRKGKHIKIIADHFSKETAFKLVSDEAFQLEASTAIRIIMDALRCMTLPYYADNDKAIEEQKDDTIRETKMLIATLAIAYQQEVKKDCTDRNEILLASLYDILDRYLPLDFVKNIENLKVMPLYELIEKLYNIFGLSAIEEQDGYMCAFFDAVAEYCETHSSELNNFVDYWDDTLHKKTLPIGEADGIRILTIHKAKGLEFHTVLLPFCEWKLEVETNSHKIWCKPTEKPLNELDMLPIMYGNDMASSIFENDYFDEKLQLWVDNLNLLYVAFTRAKENLFVWSKWNASFSEKRESERLANINDVAKLLMECLACLTPSEVSGPIKDTSDITVYEKGALNKKQEKADTKEETNKLLMKPKAIPLHLSTMQTTFAFRQSNRSEEFISGSNDDCTYIDRGLLLHNLFSSMRTKEDIPSSIKRLGIEGLIESEEKEAEIYNFALGIMERLEHKEWFDGTWQLFNECSIIYEEDGKAQTRRPDRVMVKDGNAVVLDYKFGKKYAVYHKQVKEYMKLMIRMGYSNVKGYIWYVFDNDIEEVKNG